MTESGGTTTQSGIFYQNSIAALFLGRLFDSRHRPASDRVIEVRVEAPEHVDDIVVRHADGTRSYIQAKELLDFSGEPWEKLWLNFEIQTSTALHAGETFSLILVISNYTADIGKLKELCERAHGKTTTNEWINSLSKRHRAITDRIISNFSQSTQDAVFEVLRNTEVWVWPLERIEPDYVPLWIPNANVESVALFRILRDMVGGRARIRAAFHCTEILDRLSSVHNVTVADAPHWGCDIYRHTIIATMGRLSVPGTSLSGPIQQIFMWPQLREQSVGRGHRDFEEEDLRWRWDHPSEVVDLRDYPRGDCRRAVINAGAGFGKTTLLHALACILSNDPIFVPALIPLDELVSKQTSVLGYLSDTVNREYDVNLDWEYLCDNGRAVLLFDGLDELNQKSRVLALSAITKFGGRFSAVPFLISVRDSSALNAPLGARVLEIIRLDDGMIELFAVAYKEAGAKIEPKDLLKHARRHPDLGHLIRIPLFLALLLATKGPEDDLPRNRSELLEHYLSLLVSPERYKSLASSPEPIEDLREAVELLAFRGLEHDSVGLLEVEANRILRSGCLAANPSEYIARLIQIGAINRSTSRIHFVYPILQEYLAACWLVQNSSDDVAKRFCKVVHRPWAQAIQFALEMHPEADRIICDQLNEPDDVFHTVLRLIARCVVNGAHVTPELYLELGNRLGTAWPSESYSIRRSIGYLLADGFYDPLPETVFKYISKGWALQNGGAEIVVAKAEPELTRMVLEEFLRGDLEYRYYLHDWQTAVDEIAPEALELYIDRVRKPETAEKEIEALMSLIMGLSCQTIPQERWINIACDTSLPAPIRIAGHVRCPTYMPSEAWSLMDELINPCFSGGLNEPLKVHFVLKFFWHLENAEEHFQTLMLEPNAPLESIKYLIDSLLRSDIAGETKIGLLSKTLELNNLHSERRFFLILMLAVMGCESAMVNLTKSLKNQTVEHLQHWAFHLGRFSKEQALEGLRELDLMTLNAQQFQYMVSMLSTGLNYIVEPTVSLGTVLNNQYRHPATSAFALWVSSHMESLDCSPADRLRIIDSASQIGCQGFAERVPILMEEVLGALHETPSDSEKFEAGYALSSGMRLCERESLQLREDILLRIIESPTYNANRDALDLLLKQCDERIIPRLITIYANPMYYDIHDSIFSALERLAGRYGKRIIRENGQLKAVEW
jgi:hypothetical protein